MNFNLKKKTVATLTLATAIAVTPLVFTACNTTPGDNHGTGTEQPNDTNGSYSQVLQNVIESNYYINLIDEYKKDSTQLNNKQLAVPYTFLERQGHDVDAIKNGTLKVKSDAYIKENNKNTLYISTKVENQYASGNYYTNYVLSYSILDKEYNDLHMLYRNEYIQAPFFIQELDKCKTAKVESSANIDVETYDKMLANFSISEDTLANCFTKNNIIIDVLNIDSSKEFDIAIRDLNSSYKDLVKTCKIKYLTINTTIPAGSTFNNNILKINAPDRVNFTNYDEYISNYESIVSYTANIAADYQLTL